MRGEGVGQVAEAAGLDGRAVGTPRGAARIVQRRLQRLVRGLAPRDAPRRTRRSRHQRRQRHDNEPQRRGEAPAPPHVVGVDGAGMAAPEKERVREGERGRERGKVVRRECGARRQLCGVWGYVEEWKMEGRRTGAGGDEDLLLALLPPTRYFLFFFLCFGRVVVCVGLGFISFLLGMAILLYGCIFHFCILPLSA
jgi:hypothetical protein